MLTDTNMKFFIRNIPEQTRFGDLADVGKKMNRKCHLKQRSLTTYVKLK